jgi:phenylalanyl-tRNA synthetase beta chain
LNADRPVKVVPDARRGFENGAAGRIEWGGETIGWIGKVDRSVVEKLSLRETPVAAELDLQSLLKHTQHVPQLKPLPRFPSVQRDISVLVTDAIAYEQIDSIIRKTRSDNLEDWQYVTTYRGKPLEKGTKSVTVTLIFRSPETTLTSEQVEGSVQKIVAAAKDQIGATLRV